VFCFGGVEEVVFRRLSSPCFGVFLPVDTVGVAAFALLRLFDLWRLVVFELVPFEGLRE
jgi:hypothetical protein